MASHIEGPCRKKVAIVGSGVAGLAALWALNRTHHDVYLYEAAERFGGRTNTVEWKAGKFKTLVDTGFMVMNTSACPNFLAFLKKVNIEIAPTDLSFGVSRDNGALEWAGSSLKAIFCQRRNLLSPRSWRMLFDIVRFNQFALDMLIYDDINSYPAPHNQIRYREASGDTIGQYLEREGYSGAFRDDYIVPLTAVVGAASPDMSALDVPAVFLIRLLWDLGLLSTNSPEPQWAYIPDGSKAYIDAVLRGFPSNHRFRNTAVRAVTNDEDGRVRVHLDGDRSEVFDHVILATQGDDTYSIVQGAATPEEEQILSQFRTSTTKAVLHADDSFMPRARKAWSSWNCMTRSSPGSSQGNIGRVSVTFNMNMLQHIPKDVFGNVFVTLDPMHEPDPRLVQGIYIYRHHISTANSGRAQQRLARIQNTRGISYAGAWTAYGTHEDGFTSGLQVARDHLGARLPLRLKDSASRRYHVPQPGVKALTLRLLVLIVQVFFIAIIDRAVEGYKTKKDRRGLLVNGSNKFVKKKRY